MNQSADGSWEEAIEIRRLARTMRFVLMSILLLISWYLVKATSTLPNAEAIFRDLMGGKPLPALTVLVLQCGPLLIAVSYLVPILTLAALFLRNLTRSFYLLGGLALVSALQFMILFHGLTPPLRRIALFAD